MAYYDVEAFKVGLGKLLNFIKGTNDEKMLDALESARSFDDPNETMAGISHIMMKTAKCKCPRCMVMTSMCRVQVSRFARAMNKVLSEEGVDKREERLTRELSRSYATSISTINAAILSYEVFKGIVSPSDCEKCENPIHNDLMN